MVTDESFKHIYCSFQGLQRLYDEGNDGEELDEGVCEEAVEEEEQDEEEEEKEKDDDGDEAQTKERLLPERRSRRLKIEVKKPSRGFKVLFMF